MANTVVIYKTKYGSAKRYAEWIAQDVQGDLFEHSQVTIEDVLGYDTIIYGGSLYSVGILGFSLIKKNYAKLKDKKIIVFTVGASPAYPEAVEAIKKNNFTEEMMDKIQHFHLRGGFDFKKLNWIHKVMMILLKKKIQLKKKEKRSKDEIGMLASYDKPMDWTNRKNIEPILKYIYSECAGNRV